MQALKNAPGLCKLLMITTITTIAAVVALPAIASAQDTTPDYAKPPTPRAAATATAATPSEQSDTLESKLIVQQKRLRELRYATSPDAHALAQINAELEELRAERDALVSKKAEVLTEYNARISAVASQGGTDDDKLWLAAHAASAEETADTGIKRLEKDITALKQRRRLIEAKINRERLRGSIPDAIVASTSSSSNIEFAVPEPEPEPLSDADRAHALNYLKGLVAP